MVSRRGPIRLARWIAAISLAASASAHAQSAEAEAMFNEGTKLMAAGKLAEACAAFDASNNLDPRAGTLISLGECREQNHQIASAWSAYKDALGRVKDPRKRDIATAKVAELEPRLSHLTIIVGAHKVDGLVITRNGKPVDAAIWDRSLPVDGGDYAIVASAPGYDDWKTSVTVAPEKADAKAELPALHAKPAAPPPPPSTTTTTDTDEPETPAPSPWTPRRKIAIGVAGVGAAGVITGAILGVVAKGKRDDAFKLCPDPATPCADAARADALTASGHRFAIGADVGFAIAAAGAIGAGVLWLTGKPESATRTALVPTANGLAVAGRF